jgi:ribonuclease BN (tRNA processing enzyme)
MIIRRDGMNVIFTGVGEAFDEALGNTSLLVLFETKEVKRQVLLDCGFTAAHAFWRESPDPLELDAVWISHFHGDHFFGLPLLLLRFWEEGRKRPLVIIGQNGIGDKVTAALDLAYPRFRPKLGFEIEVLEVTPTKDLQLLGLRWSFAENGHSSPCLALRLDHDQGSVFYSGDGGPTDATRALAAECELIVHEAFGLDELHAGHGSVNLCIDFALKLKAKALALVHMNRNVRRSRAAEVRQTLARLTPLKALLPEPGDRLNIEELCATKARSG